MKGIDCDGSICNLQGRPTENGDERRESDDDTSMVKDYLDVHVHRYWIVVRIYPCIQRAGRAK